MNYHIDKKHNNPKPVVTFKCKLCYQKFAAFYALSQHKNTQHSSSNKTANVDPEDNINEIDDANLERKLRSSQHFLVDSEIERARHKVFNYAVEALSETILNEKFENFFNNSNCAAKLNLVFGFTLKNKEDGGFRNF